MLKLKEVIKQTAAIETRCQESKVVLYNMDLEPIGEYGFNMIGEIIEELSEERSVFVDQFKSNLKNLGVDFILKNKYNINI